MRDHVKNWPSRRFQLSMAVLDGAAAIADPIWARTGRLAEWISIQTMGGRVLPWRLEESIRAAFDTRTGE